MSSVVPEEWKVEKFRNVCGVINGQVDPNKQPYSDMKHIGPGNVEKHTGRLLEVYTASQDGQTSGKYLFNETDVLYGKINPHFAKVAFPQYTGVCSADMYPINCKDDLRPAFLFHYLLSDEFTNYAVSVSGRTGMPKINRDDLDLAIVRVPPLPEQKKIASILTSVDEVIENTQKQIDKLQDLKKATMNELLTKGIGHTEFKDSELGRIPKSWEMKPYSDLVTVEMPPISLKDHSYYAPVVVRRRHNGVETRGEKLGSSILVKTQYEALPNTFLISKRQIFHGSCGIIPKDIGANAIISKEYLSLKTNESMDLRFLNYFSRTENFQNQIVRTTYGVDEEKFVFKVQWWMKEQIVCPSREEQINICNVVDGIEAHLNTAELKLSQTQSLKKSLMQDLLTGKVRVALN